MTEELNQPGNRVLQIMPCPVAMNACFYDGDEPEKVWRVKVICLALVDVSEGGDRYSDIQPVILDEGMLQLADDMSYFMGVEVADDPEAWIEEIGYIEKREKP